MELFELETKYTRGFRTAIFIFVRYAWFMSLFGSAILYIVYEMNYGRFADFTQAFFAQHTDWVVDSSMLSQWLLLLGGSFILLGFVRAWELYAQYKFILDEDAFHLKRGIFFIKEVTIPYHQISNVHISRPYHYWLLGLSQIDIVTTSVRSFKHNKKAKDYLIPVIDARLAKRLSHQLIKYANREKLGVEVDDEDYDEEDK